MTRLEELINKLCPDGVEFKPISSFIKRSREKGLKEPSIKQVYVVSNSKGMVRAEEYRDTTIHSDDTSNYIIVRPGMCAYNPARLNIGSIAILKDNNPGLVSPMYVVFSIDHDVIMEEYFEYILDSSYVKNKIDAYKEEGARFRFDYERWGWINIPLPPLEIQKEIVSILSKFKSLIDELMLESDARQKQYEHYMDQLFEMNEETKKVKLMDVLLSLKTGLNPRKFFELNTPDAAGYYVTVREIGNRSVRYWESKDKVNQYGLDRINERSNLEVNDVLFSGTGTIGRVSLVEEKPTNWNVKEGVYILKPNLDLINPVFLMYLMKSNYMKNIYSNYIVGSPVSSVPMKDLKNVEFYLPTMEKQEKIVNILDSFDKLCNDITFGLPAEIEKRKKQYEYYRDKLLSFKEVEVNE